MIEDLYPEYLLTGNNPLLFWDLTISEISKHLEVFNRNKRETLKQQILLCDLLSDQIANRIAKIVDSEVEIVKIWDYFPDLFEKEKQQSEKFEKEMQLKRYKEKFINFAMKHNSERSD